MKNPKHKKARILAGFFVRGDFVRGDAHNSSRGISSRRE